MWKRFVYYLIILFTTQLADAQPMVFTLQPGPVEGIDTRVFSLPCNSSWAITNGQCSTTVYGSDQIGYVNSWTYSSTPGICRSFLRFDLAAYTQLANNLVHAELTLYNPPGFDHSNLSGSNAFHLTRVLSAWNEASLVWNNQPSVASTNLTDSANRIPIAAPASPTAHFVVNLTAMVRYWLQNPTENHGFMGQLANEGYYRSVIFALSDYLADTTLRPKLVLTFNNPRTSYYSKSTGNLNQLATWGTNTDGSGTSPLSFDSNNVTYYVRNNVNPITGGSLNINGTNSILVLGDGTNPFNLAVASSDTLACDSIYINNSVTLTVSGRVISTKVAAGTSATAQYIGTSSPQYIAAGKYTNLLVNGNGADKSLTGNTTVTNNFVMIATVNTLTHTLTLGTSPANTGTLTRNAGTINGRFTRWFAASVNSGTSGLFPVGVTNRYAPFQLNFTSAPATGGTVTTEFISSDPGIIGLPIPDFSNGFIFIDKTAMDGYWKVSGTGITNSDVFTVTATVNNFTGVNNYLDLRLLKRNPGGSWISSGNHITSTGSNTSAVISRSGLTTIESEYGIGSDKSINPLPVKLISFDGKRMDHSVELNWSTASEINNKGFEVQRSVDGKYFEKTGFVKGNGSTAVSSSYTFTDRNAIPGEVLYYRLNQLDVNGASSLTNTITISAVQSLSTASFSVYPNPSSHTITLKGLEQPAMVYDALGNKVMMIGTDETTDITSLANGIYFIRSGTRVQKLVKQ